MNYYIPTNWIVWNEIDKLLKTYTLQRLNHEEIENINCNS